MLAIDIEKKLQEGMRLGLDESAPQLFGYVLGVYDSRILGLCIFRANREQQENLI